MMDIRPCLESDLPVVVDLMDELAEAASPPTGFSLEQMARTFAGLERRPDIYLNLVGVVDGEVVAFLSLIFYQTLFHAGGTALINELVVTRSHRRRGIGRALLDRARTEAQARGMDELEVATELDNEPARAFYRACGFNQEFVLFGQEFDAG
jgi:ribosomal protein S18 acetylase RimI-like enzyme